MNGNLSILGYYGYANTGDEAILDCLIAGLRDASPEWNITVFSGNPANTIEQYGVGAVHDILPTRLSRFLVGALGRNRRNFYRAIRTFLSTDVLLVGGGGLFFDHEDSNRFLRELLCKIRAATALGKKVLVVGVSLGPIHHADSRRRLSRVLNAVDLITVRDAESRTILHELGISRPQIETTGDFVFLLRPVADDHVDRILNLEGLMNRNRPIVAVSVCGYHINVPEWKKSLVAFCRHVIDRYNARIWFVPMQTGGGFDDREGPREIARECARHDSISLIENSYTPRETLGILSRADAVLAERLHGVILSLIARTPLFGISYRPKVSRLFAEIGHSDWQLDLKQIAPESLIAGFSRIWTSRNEIRKELENVSFDMIRRAQSNFDFIKPAITGR